LLISFGAIQLRREKLHLPLQITPAISFTSSPARLLDNGLTRLQAFIWFCLALLPVAIGVFMLPVFVPLLLRSLHHGSTFWDPVALSPWMYRLQSLLTDLPLPLAALWAMGGERKDLLRQALRVPSRKYFALAILFPVVVYWLPSTCASLVKRADLLSRGPDYFFGLPMKPEFLFFFLLPLFAEIAWRGYLQPQLVSRYGVFRALFLVGVIWGITYFGVFPSIIWADAGVLLRLTGGIIWGLGYSFVFGWLTIRSGSILPAAVAAGLADILLRATLYDAYAVLRPETVRATGVAIWCVIAVALFRYWPIQEKDLSNSAEPAAQS
jgi:membrane protease YdiL (CAAX protease family)